jgi:hypothetical protein
MLGSLYSSGIKPPNVLNAREFMEAVRAEAPESIGRSNGRVSVTLSISVSAEGKLTSVKAVVPQPHPGVSLRAFRVDESGRSLGEFPARSSDPECMAAAERAAAVLRFVPATLNGAPVAFPDLRIGVEFGGGAPTTPGSPS